MLGPRVAAGPGGRLAIGELNPSEARFASARRLLPGGRVVAAWPLPGGVASDVHALQLEGSDGQRRTVVVRRPGEGKPAARRRRAVATEHELVSALYRLGFPVPEPLLLVTTGPSPPAPFLVTAFVDGSTDIVGEALGASLDLAAGTLARLHHLPTGAVPDLPVRVDPLRDVFFDLPEDPAWRALRVRLRRETESRYRDRPALLHGDFWPGNLLWQRGRLAAVLDWEDAALGDPAADVAGCRLELLWAFGPAAMQRFTATYERHHPLDPRRRVLWEIAIGAAAARKLAGWGLEPAREEAMRRGAYAFVRAAGRSLGGKPRAR